MEIKEIFMEIDELSQQDKELFLKTIEPLIE
jgi:hypothetical protein